MSGQKTSAQLHNQSNINSSTSLFTLNDNKDSNDYLRGKSSSWHQHANSRQNLHHQKSFHGGVSYLGVIKERERSDSGFSGDVEEDCCYSNDPDESSAFDMQLAANAVLSEEMREEDQNENTPTTRMLSNAFPIRMPAKINAYSRRESYDSGLSVSPTTPTPQFHIEMEHPTTMTPSNLEQSNQNAKKEGNSVEPQLPPAGRRRKKKKRLTSSLSVTNFSDVYRMTGEILGQGSYGKVEGCANIITNVEYAVKIISKSNWHFSRAKMLKEIELYHLCQGIPEIIQLIEFFEETDHFYLVFEKAEGGPLLSQIQRRVHFTEREAASIIRDLAAALSHLHSRGIAHRDLKPENILCYKDAGTDGKSDFLPVKLCDFDLCSAVYQSITTPKLQSPVGSVEYMAPEVVEAFSFDLDFFGNEDFNLDNCDEGEDDVELTYDKRCDLWSLGIIAYILLCGYLPFSGRCGEDCGWEDRGEECAECQHRLFQSIKSGNLIFPERHWSGVSSNAKDLITKLLVRDASQRLNATSILDHPWINQHCNTQINSISSPDKTDGNTADTTDLETPRVLRARDSAHEMCLIYSEFASNALAIKRNCDDGDQQGAIAISKKSMKKAATISQLFQASHLLTTSSSNSNNKQTLGCQERFRVEKLLPQNNNDKNEGIENVTKSLQFGCNDASQINGHPNNINFNNHDADGAYTFPRNFEQQQQHPSPTSKYIIQRQQSYQPYLTHPSPLSKQMRRQTSLVVCVDNFENGMNDEGCRWEF